MHPAAAFSGWSLPGLYESPGVTIVSSSSCSRICGDIPEIDDEGYLRRSILEVEASKKSSDLRESLMKFELNGCGFAYLPQQAD